MTNAVKPKSLIHIVVRSLFFTYICKRKFFTTRYLRAVGQQWMCPADSLPCFFKLTWLMKAEMPETQLSSAESPMQGNNWRPAHPDGGERPTSFLKSQNLFDNMLCRFTMTHNSFICAIKLRKAQQKQEINEQNNENINIYLTYSFDKL